jgi:chromosome partitioning protein
MQVISIASQKGGVGKTSTTVNLAARLAMAGYRVLVVDLEPQAQAGTALGVNLIGDDILKRSLGMALQFALQKLPGTPLKDIMFDQSHLLADFADAGRLCVLASEEETMSTVQDMFVTKPHNMTPILRRMLVEQFSDDFDYVLIDTPPSVRALNAVGTSASDWVIAVYNPEYATAKGVLVLRSAVEKVTELTGGECNPQFLGVLLNQSNPESKLTIMDIEVSSAVWEGGLLPFMTEIRRDVRIAQAYFTGVPAVIPFLKLSPGKQYTALVEELLDRIDLPRAEWKIALPLGMEEEVDA